MPSIIYNIATMTVDNKSYIGGPGCFGIDLEVPNHVHEWIVLTPAGQDPRQFMSDDEITAFDRSISPIGELEFSEQDIYFDLIRSGSGIDRVREIASYDKLV